MTGSTHQPPLCRLRRQQPAKKERKPSGLDDRTTCLMRRFALAERRSFSRLGRWRVFPMLGKMVNEFSNVWIFRPDSFQSLDLMNAVSLRSLIPTPTVFQVPFSPCSVNSTRRKPSLQTRPPTPPGNSPRVCAYGANVAAICLFGGKSLPGAFHQFSRPAPLRLAQAGRRWGRASGPPRSGFAGFTPRAPVTPRRDAVSCRLLCAPFTGCGRNMPASAGKELGRLRTCFVFHLGRS